MMAAGVSLLAVGVAVVVTCRSYQPYDHSDPIPITLVGMAVGAVAALAGAVLIAVRVIGS